MFIADSSCVYQTLSISDSHFVLIVPVWQRFLASGDRWFRPWNTLFRCRSDNIDDLAVQLVDVVVCDISYVDLVVDAIAEDIPVGVGGFPPRCSNTLSFWARVDCYDDRDVVGSHRVVERSPSALRRQLT